MTPATASDTAITATGRPARIRPTGMEGLSAWVVSDGKIGDQVQCFGVAHAMGLAPDLRVVNPRAPFNWLMPRGPIDPREAPHRRGSPIAPPWPDVLIASGRRTVAYMRTVKRLSGGHSFTIYLKDPRTGPDSADLIWVPAHDDLRGDAVVATVASPHGVTQAILADQRALRPSWLPSGQAPKVAVVVGGDSVNHRFSRSDIAKFAALLDQLAMSGAMLMGSRSRRTSAALDAAIGAVMRRHGGWWWDGTGPNPYVPLLAHADAVVATADSVNMIGEAAATGRPVLVFEPSGGHAKIRRFLDGLAAHGIVHRFEGRLVGERYEPLDCTTEIARVAMQRLHEHRRLIGASAAG